MIYISNILQKENLLSRFILSNIQDNVCQKYQRVQSPYALRKCSVTSYNSQYSDQIEYTSLIFFQ